MYTFLSTSIALWTSFAQVSWDGSEVPIIMQAPAVARAAAGVRDREGVFSPEASRRAREELRKIQRDCNAAVMVETVDSFEGKEIGDLARRWIRRAGPGGIYILIAKDERDVAVFGFEGAHGDRRLSGPAKDTVRESFLAPLREGDADGGLERGIREIDRVLTESRENRVSAGSRDRLVSTGIIVLLLCVLPLVRMRDGKPPAVADEARPSQLSVGGS